MNRIRYFRGTRQETQEFKAEVMVRGPGYHPDVCATLEGKDDW